MKWLILFPAWVFLLSYVIYRVKEANRKDPAVVAAPAELGAPPLPAPGPSADQPEARRPPSISGQMIAQSAQQFRHRVELLPPQSGGPAASPLWPPDIAPGPQDLSSFDAWKLFESDEVSFYYPDAEGYAVERLGGEAPPTMFGGIFYQADHPPQRWYRVVGAGGLTWCAFAVDAHSAFDDSERYPAAEVFHKLLIVEGGVARASCSVDGLMGRVQWLGRGVRLSLLDWQHCAAHRDAYHAVASTLKLSSAARRDTAGAASLANGFGLEARMGLLERGMGTSEVEPLLGKPAGTAGDTWVYHVPDRDGDRFYRVAFANGVFEGLREDWRTVRKDPPIRGSLDWMLEKTQLDPGEAGGVGYNLGPLTDADVELIFGELRARLPAATGSDWSDLCKVAANLAEMRLRDDAVLQILIARFPEPQLAPRSAIVVLQAWDADTARDLFAAKCADVLGDPHWTSVDAGAGTGFADDLELLLAHVGGAHPQSETLVIKAAEHPNGEVRAVGCSFWEWLPEPRRLPLLRRGVGDVYPRVRRRCAEAFALGNGSAADRPLLEARLAAESDAEAREHLALALEKLGAAGGG